MRTVKLVFCNHTIANDPDYGISGVEVVNCDYGSLRAIVQWYAAFYSGDDISITANGILISLDLNNEIETEIVTAITPPHRETGY